MMPLSFAWTEDAFLANRKTRTRREWKDSYAKKFRVGDKCQAWDKQARFGGRRIGIIVIKAIFKQHISKMPDEDYEKEGFAFMEENGIKIWGKNPRQAFEDWRKDDYTPWVVDFERIE